VNTVDERGEFLLGDSVVGQVIRPHLDSSSGATADLQLNCSDIVIPPGTYNESTFDSSPTPCVVDNAESRGADLKCHSMLTNRKISSVKCF
jgi:hypothetical protein